jgi:small GTP-binding protein
MGDSSCKLIMVGSSGVGKTSLLDCLYKQQFDNRSMPTVAPTFSEFKIEGDSGEIVEFQIWDTAGQEQYQSVSQMFYRDAKVALVCYDQSEVGSIEKWINRVKDHTVDCIIYLVSTKSDLLSESDLSLVTDEGEEHAQRSNAKHFVTSAQTGQGITDVFRAAATDFRKSQGSAPHTQEIMTPAPKLVQLGEQPKVPNKGCC